MLLQAIKELWKRYIIHDVNGYAVQMSYFLILSLFPFLMFLMTVLGYLSISVDDAIYFLSLVAPKEVMVIISKYIEYLLTRRNVHLLFGSLVTTFWTSSNSLNVLMRAINKAFKLEETRGYVRRKLLAAPFTILLTGCISIALVLPALGREFLLWLSRYVSISSLLIEYLTYIRWVIAVVCIFYTIMMIYHLVPNKRFPFRQVLPGAIIATIGWIIISVGFSSYVSNVPGYSAIYGSIGAVIILMIWLYLGSMIIIMGSEFNSMLLERQKPGMQSKMRIIAQGTAGKKDMKV